MIRRALIALAAAAVIGAVGCGPAAADDTFHDHTETAQYTIDITYPLDYPDIKSVSDFVNVDRGLFLDWIDRGPPMRAWPGIIVPRPGPRGRKRYLPRTAVRRLKPNLLFMGYLALDGALGTAGHAASSTRHAG